MNEATNIFLKRIADALARLVEIEEEKLKLYKNYREFIDSEEFAKESEAYDLYYKEMQDELSNKT